MAGKSGRTVAHWNALLILFGLLLGEKCAHKAGASTENDPRRSFSTMAAASETSTPRGDDVQAWSLGNRGVMTGLHGSQKGSAAPSQWAIIENSRSATASAKQKASGNTPASTVASGTGVEGISTPGQSQHQRSQQGTSPKEKDQSSQDEDEDEEDEEKTKKSDLETVRLGFSPFEAVHPRGSGGGTQAGLGLQTATAENPPSPVNLTHETALDLVPEQGMTDAVIVDPARDNAWPTPRNSLATLRDRTKYPAMRLPERSSSSMVPYGDSAMKRGQRRGTRRTARQTTMQSPADKLSDLRGWLGRRATGGAFLSRGSEAAGRSVWRKRLAAATLFASGLFAGVALTELLKLLLGRTQQENAADEYFVPAVVMVATYGAQDLQSQPVLIGEITGSGR